MGSVRRCHRHESPWPWTHLVRRCRAGPSAKAPWPCPHPALARWGCCHRCRCPRWSADGAHRVRVGLRRVRAGHRAHRALGVRLRQVRAPQRHSWPLCFARWCPRRWLCCRALGGRDDRHAGHGARRVRCCARQDGPHGEGARHGRGGRHALHAHRVLHGPLDHRRDRCGHRGVRHGDHRRFDLRGLVLSCRRRCQGWPRVGRWRGPRGWGRTSSGRPAS